MEVARPRHTRGLELTIASQRRKQIVAAARACMTEEGVEKLTLRKVAERAAVSHATIAYYFHTRQELVDAALLDASEEFMGVLRRRELVYGPEDLEELVRTFLDAANPSARFVVQMIDAGLHDLQLRATHEEFVQYGRERIERSIRVGMETGVYRSDIDPRLAAALLHTLLIWWESELAAEATSQELALGVGRLALQLLRRPVSERADAPSTKGHAPAGENGAGEVRRQSALQMIEAGLRADPDLSPRAAGMLTESFRGLYGLAVAASGGAEEE